MAGLARKLAAWQGRIELRVVPFTEAQKALRDSGDGRLAVVLYRRMMMRVAERIARERGAKALVTGEALAQVASQTLENLAVIGSVVTLPILRPLIAHDKLDTIAVAQRIGTYELSIAPDSFVYDGRFANNGWLQETPRPVTRLTWDNALMMSPTTAPKRSVKLMRSISAMRLT